MDIRNIMIGEMERVTTTSDRIRNRIKELPKGSLKVYKNGKYYKYKVAKGDVLTPLTQKDGELMELLAMKSVYENMMESIDEYVTNIKKYIDLTKEIDISGLKYLADNPGIATLVQKRYISKDERIMEWEYAEYSSTAGHPENLIFGTLKGHKVRSKAEMTIANQAFMQKLPYRYECDMQLKNGKVTTDFLFKNPQTMVEIPMEHFGMLEITSYFKNTTEKMKNYISSGFFPSINMLVSYELDSRPLDTSYVQKLFDQFWDMSSIKFPWQPQVKY